MINKFILSILVFFYLLSQNSFSIEIEFEQSKSVPLIFLSVAIKTGSTSDPTGKDGLTYLLGESLLRGTKNKTKTQIDTLLDQLGGSLSVDIRSEALEISGSVLAKEIDGYLNLFTEILSEPSFSDTEISKLKAETLSAIASGKANDKSLLRYYWPKIFFGNHPYGNIRNGLEKTIKNISKEDLVNHYKKIFQTNNIIAVGSGDAEPRKIITWGKNIKLNPNTADSLPQYTAPTIPNSRRVVIIDKPNRTQAQILISQKGGEIQSKDYYALSIINHGFGGSSFQSRLMQEIRVKTGWSYGAGSYFNYARFPYAWNIYYFPAQQFLEKSLSKTLDLYSDLHKNGLTKKEFEFSKNSLIQSAGFIYDTPMKRVSNALNEKLLGLPRGFYSEYASNIKSLTLDDVNNSAKKFFNPSEVTIVVVATASTSKSDISQATGTPVNEITIYPYDKIEDFLGQK